MMKAKVCCANSTEFSNVQTIENIAAPTVCPVLNNIQLPTSAQNNSQFGNRIVVSRDGSTLAVGAAAYAISTAEGAKTVGAVFVYTKSSEKSYTLLQVLLNPLLSDTKFGFSIAIAANGRRLLVSASQEAEKGAVYVYDRPLCQSCFTEPQKIVSSLEESTLFGTVFNLSPDGTVAIISSLKSTEKIEVWASESKYSKFYLIDALDVGDAAISLFLEHDVVVRGIFSISLSEFGRFAALGAPFLTKNEVQTGAVLLYERNICTDKWVLVDVLIDQPDGQTVSQIGDDVAITPDGKNLAVYAGRSVDFSAAFFTSIYRKSTPSKHLEFLQFIAANASQSPFTSDTLPFISLSDDACLLSIAYAESNQKKGLVEILSRSSVRETFENFQFINGVENNGLFGNGIEISGDGKSLFVSNSLLKPVTTPGGDTLFETEDKVFVYESKKFFSA